MRADRNFAECQLTDVEGRVADWQHELVEQGMTVAEAVERIEQENNFADVAEALADPVFRAWLLGEPHPAAERDRLAALLQQVEKFTGAALAEKCARCHLFVELLDNGTVMHWHRGDEADEALDDSHVAEQSGLVATLDVWKAYGPPEMRARFVDANQS